MISSWYDKEPKLFFHEKELKNWSIAVARSTLSVILPSKDGNVFINQLTTSDNMILEMLKKRYVDCLFYLVNNFHNNYKNIQMFCKYFTLTGLWKSPHAVRDKGVSSKQGALCSAFSKKVHRQNIKNRENEN